MKIRKVNSFNQNWKSSSTLKSLYHLNPKNTNVLPKNDEILFSHKTSLEIMLGIIKKSQIEYINDNSSSNLKKILTEFKTNLSEIVTEQEKISTMLTNQKNTKKKRINKYYI